MYFQELLEYMAKFVSVNSKYRRYKSKSSNNIFSSLWGMFSGADRFTKWVIVTAVIFAVVTPSYLAIKTLDDRSHASYTPPPGGAAPLYISSVTPEGCKAGIPSYFVIVFHPNYNPNTIKLFDFKIYTINSYHVFDVKIFDDNYRTVGENYVRGIPNVFSYQAIVTITSPGIYGTSASHPYPIIPAQVYDMYARIYSSKYYFTYHCY